MITPASSNTQGAAPLALIVNGVPLISRALTLAELISEAGYGDAKLATARNGAFVPERMRDATLLYDGDRVEILSPRQGG